MPDFKVPAGEQGMTPSGSAVVAMPLPCHIATSSADVASATVTFFGREMGLLKISNSNATMDATACWRKVGKMIDDPM
ncbi:hypothetical protein V494_02195 [Pseudogymnoascus sp. VKM F-4513 (FW-928)]|nr:hypothetical protein V494_02195 [Pseudogymnoascus sp. VKM F-4513 (FW-928)]